MDQFDSAHFVTSDGVRLHYLDAGSGPPLVFVPGWTMPAWIWEPQLRHFRVTHRVVALDPRGQGSSEKPTMRYHATRRARDICELLDHLGGEPAVVVGWSLGVQEVLVGTRVVGTERIRVVVLVDHPIVIDPEVLSALVAERVASQQVNREAWTRSFVEEILEPAPSDEYLEALTQAVLATLTNAAAIMMANLYLVGPTDLRPALDALDRPALFVYSSLDWATASAEEIRKGWTEIQVKVVDDTPHALFVVKLQEFNFVLEEFLASLPNQ